MKKIAYIMIAGTLALSAMSCSKKNETDSQKIAEEVNDEKLSETKITGDADFVVEAANCGMLEVQLGQLAQKNASSADVKRLGQSISNEHGKINEELKQLASKKDITLSIALSDKNQKEYEDLASKGGAEFDKAYTDFVVKNHKTDIDQFKKEAEKGNDTEVKAWAAEKIASLEHHLSSAETVHEATKDKK